VRRNPALKACWRSSASPVETPLQRAIERDEALVQQWLSGSARSPEYPKIKASAQREKAGIYFNDAAYIRSGHLARRT
jgi:hypothetical protein